MSDRLRMWLQELWNVVETTSLGRLAEHQFGAAGHDSGALEREDLLGNPGQICCDFVTQYLSAIVQHESFLSLEQEQLTRVLRSGLAVVPTERLMESVHKWVDAKCLSWLERTEQAEAAAAPESSGVRQSQSAAIMALKPPGAGQLQADQSPLSEQQKNFER